jgi:hypothetical protein
VHVTFIFDALIVRELALVAPLGELVNPRLVLGTGTEFNEPLGVIHGHRIGHGLKKTVEN